MNQLMLAGDWHGYAPHARWVAKTARKLGIECIFQLGDFGMWEHEKSGVQYLADLQKIADENDVDIYCLDGNHDNWVLALQLHADRIDDEGFVHLTDRVRYAPRGHRWTWDGVRFLALGGAYSVDKESRLHWELEKSKRSAIAHARYGAKLEDFSGTLWFPDEELTDDNVQTALGDGSPVDVMLTHDKPLSSEPSWNRKSFDECRPNQEKVQRVMEELRPLYLVHGHLHYAYTDQVRTAGHDGGAFTTTVVGLNADSYAMDHERGYRPETSVAVLTWGGDDGLTVEAVEKSTTT